MVRSDHFFCVEIANYSSTKGILPLVTRGISSKNIRWQCCTTRSVAPWIAIVNNFCANSTTSHRMFFVLRVLEITSRNFNTKFKSEFYIFGISSKILNKGLWGLMNIYLELRLWLIKLARLVWWLTARSLLCTQWVVWMEDIMPLPLQLQQEWRISIFHFSRVYCCHMTIHWLQIQQIIQLCRPTWFKMLNLPFLT